MKIHAIQEIDLAGRWDFIPEGGGRTTIQVPGGGWLKQGFDCEAGTYERRITIPDTGSPQTVRLELGAVNHLAVYFVGKDESSLSQIAQEVTAFTPQVVDLTPHVRAGETYLLRIFVRAFENGRPIAPHWAEWCECIARGIFRDAYLRVYPPVYVSDALVKASVSDNTLTCQVTLSNSSPEDKIVVLGGELSSWNGDPWPYPSIPDASIEIKAGQTQKVRLGPVDWTPGEASFWWPNVPFREGYRARLHDLRLTLAHGPKPIHSASVRFGFRQIDQVGPYYELNGTRVNFRGDNLQVANYDRIDYGGQGDAIDTLPGFLPPAPGNPGWPQAVHNFLKLNYNVQREHMGPWTPYMLDVCDEMGLMLIGESACRWDGFDMENGRGFHEVKCLKDIVRRDKNHPSIIRWSAKNEPQCLDESYHVELYGVIKSIDDTKPISEDIVVADWNVFDVNKVFKRLKDEGDFTWIDHYLTFDEERQPFSSTILHNDAVIPMHDRPFGLGEADWMRCSTPAGLTWFATTIALARVQGASDVRPYVLLSSWASSIPGVKTTDFVTEENRHPVYGEDNLPDPWNHPGIKLLQVACHPLLALDAEFWQANRSSDGLGHFCVFPRVKAGSTVTREITLFNDEFWGEQVDLHWDVREGSPSNRILDGGELTVTVPLGFSRQVSITFNAPIFNTYVFLTLKVGKDGVERFRDTSTCFEVADGVDFKPEFNGEERTFL